MQREEARMCFSLCRAERWNLLERQLQVHHTPLNSHFLLTWQSNHILLLRVSVVAYLHHLQADSLFRFLFRFSSSTIIIEFYQ